LNSLYKKINKEKDMRKEKIRKLILFAVLSSIIIIATFTNIGFINIGGIATITIIPIFVIIGAIILGTVYGTLLGTIFGICSMVMAFMLAGPNLPFTNPLLSVLPRSIFGFVIYPLYKVFSKNIKQKWGAIALTSISTCLIHSLLVLGIMYPVARYGFFFYAGSNSYFTYLTTTNVFVFIGTALLANAIIEVIFTTIITVPVGTALLTYFDNQYKVDENIAFYYTDDDSSKSIDAKNYKEIDVKIEDDSSLDDKEK